MFILQKKDWEKYQMSDYQLQANFNKSKTEIEVLEF